MAYFVLATSAVAFTRLSNNVALLWIASAPLLAALLTRPAGERPFHLIACFGATIAASVVASPHVALAPLFGIANVGETLLAYTLLHRLGAASRTFLSLRSLMIFIAIAAVVAPVATGVLPASALWWSQGADPAVIWSNWVIAHGLGAVIGTPVALLLFGGSPYRERIVRSGDLLRLMWVAALLVGVTGACFAQVRLPLLFLPMLPLIVATMTFRFEGAAFGVFVIAMIGAGFTLAGSGPIQLIEGSEAFHLQFFQFYVAVLFLIAMPFATMITEKHRLASAVAQSEARYRLIAEHASDTVLVLDAQGQIQYASPAVRELSGFEPAMLIGRNGFQFVGENERQRAQDVHMKTLADPSRTHRHEFRATTITGASRWCELTARAVVDENGVASSVVTIIRDLTQRKAREADLERQAATDPMTGVLNRRAFHERMARFRDMDESTATLALFDLDHFKQVNDSHGHEAGDAALLVFADVMRANLRTEDVIGRLGGEEFAVLFPGRTAVDAFAACERVRSALAAAPITTTSSTFTITVSIGVAPVRVDETSEGVFREADVALYRAKSLGRNRSELTRSQP